MSDTPRTDAFMESLVVDGSIPLERAAEIVTFAQGQERENAALRGLLGGAEHALRSYQFGNGSPELAESMADHIAKAVSKSQSSQGHASDCAVHTDDAPLPGTHCDCGALPMECHSQEPK